MNKVTISKPEKIPKSYPLAELIGPNFRNDRTAFIGQIGTCSGLFLLTYSGVFMADTPEYTWERGCNILVNQFVDVNIKNAERDDR